MQVASQPRHIFNLPQLPKIIQNSHSKPLQVYAMSFGITFGSIGDLIAIGEIAWMLAKSLSEGISGSGEGTPSIR
jgi:hypothetical protein